MIRELVQKFQVTSPALSPSLKQHQVIHLALCISTWNCEMNTESFRPGSLHRNEIDPKEEEDGRKWNVFFIVNVAHHMYCGWL